jgi:starch synthase
MYAQRFGSLPIGLETGGLAETIEDGKTGFLFRNHSVGAFVGALYRALSVFDVKSKLNAMRCTAMTRAFSWEKSVRDYTGLYERARMKCLC